MRRQWAHKNSLFSFDAVIVLLEIIVVCMTFVYLLDGHCRHGAKKRTVMSSILGICWTFVRHGYRVMPISVIKNRSIHSKEISNFVWHFHEALSRHTCTRARSHLMSSIYMKTVIWPFSLEWERKFNTVGKTFSEFFGWTNTHAEWESEKERDMCAGFECSR